MADETPLDRFRSVLTGASRAISHEPELEVAWTADMAVANGKNLRLNLQPPVWDRMAVLLNKLQDNAQWGVGAPALSNADILATSPAGGHVH